MFPLKRSYCVDHDVSIVEFKVGMFDHDGNEDQSLTKFGMLKGSSCVER